MPPCIEIERESVFVCVVSMGRCVSVWVSESAWAAGNVFIHIRKRGTGGTSGNGGMDQNTLFCPLNLSKNKIYNVFIHIRKRGTGGTSGNGGMDHNTLFGLLNLSKNKTCNIFIHIRKRGTRGTGGNGGMDQNTLSFSKNSP